MAYLLSHWHCVVPVLGLLAAALLLRKGNGAEGRPAEVTKELT
jgi:hypothetical protein